MKKVLFVCVENACRSQMAEAFFNRISKAARASSAGTRPASDVNPLAVQAMRETGIDISQARPKLLALEVLEGADRVITMGCAVGDACPGAVVKAEDWGIEDPAGKTIDEFRKVRDIIRKKVERLVIDLEGKSPCI